MPDPRNLYGILSFYRERRIKSFMKRHRKCYFPLSIIFLVAILNSGGNWLNVSYEALTFAVGNDIRAGTDVISVL